MHISKLTKPRVCIRAVSCTSAVPQQSLQRGRERAGCPTSLSFSRPRSTHYPYPEAGTHILPTYGFFFFFQFFFFKYLFIYLFIYYLWLCWVFVSVCSKNFQCVIIYDWYIEMQLILFILTMYSVILLYAPISSSKIP